VALLAPHLSLAVALKMDDQSHTQFRVKTMWHQLHRLAYSVIRGATLDKVGKAFFELIEADQEEAGLTCYSQHSYRTRITEVVTHISYRHTSKRS